MSSAEQLFLQVFKGQFFGVLRWHQLDLVWDFVRKEAATGWYIYAIGEQPPAEPASDQQVQQFVNEIDQLLRREHSEDYCGIVYVDNLQHPQFIKIFDPNQLGSACGSSGAVTLPGWLLCKIKPAYLSNDVPPTQSRQRWWRRLFD